MQLDSLRVAGVLYVDIVRYSAHTTKWQMEAMARLHETASESETFVKARDAGEAIAVSSGDGFILAFLSAMEMKELVAAKTELEITMAINVGAVGYMEKDVTGSPNIAGEGVKCCSQGSCLRSRRRHRDHGASLRFP